MPKKNPTKSYYERKAESLSALKTNSFYHEKPFVLFASLLPKNARVLDIGCAGGIHVPLFLGIGRHLKYQGLDITRAFLNIARRRYPHLTFHEGDISDRTTVPKKKFNGFFAAAVLMHIPFEKWPEMFANIETITKPGAIGYVSLPVEHPSEAGTKDDQRHFTLLTPREQTEYFKSRNWKILKRGTADGFSKKGIWRWYVVQLP